MNTDTTRKSPQFCKVYVAMPQSWKNKENVMKRALGAIQRAHPHLAILGVNEPCYAHAHYFIDTSGKSWCLKKHRELQLETLPLNQGVDIELDFTIQAEKKAEAEQLKKGEANAKA